MHINGEILRLAGIILILGATLNLVSHRPDCPGMDTGPDGYDVSAFLALAYGVVGAVLLLVGQSVGSDSELTDIFRKRALLFGVLGAAVFSPLVLIISFGEYGGGCAWRGFDLLAYSILGAALVKYSLSVRKGISAYLPVIGVFVLVAVTFLAYLSTAVNGSFYVSMTEALFIFVTGYLTSFLFFARREYLRSGSVLTYFLANVLVVVGFLIPYPLSKAIPSAVRIL